ncbi:CBS domain-containing protein [Metallosphaera tengchongensis]|uniref:CBS domain-containing protein n=1 Tax=Metallosphaera tengchongensis TaxID=1532350 RepID=A0A6N0NTX0_9CREN|nr:CBS domain-containing protein [Metallosphaera tengchongensis]QKQ99576.1 CBS domain-containing protein [Metallosphaera tengchongensis]
MTVKDLISREPVSVSPNATIVEAAKIMKRERVGSLLVRIGEEAKGILSERDIIYAIASDLPLNTRVEEVMSTNLVTADSGMDVGEAALLLADKGVRHLVIKENGKIIGVISIRDIARSLGLLTTDLSVW